MKFKKGIAILPLLMIMLALLAAPHSRAAQQKPEPKQPADKHDHTSAGHKSHDAAEADRITVEELKAKIEKNEPVTIIDLRSESSYESSDKKIKGSVRMITDEIESRLKEIPRDTLVVTYCT